MEKQSRLLFVLAAVLLALVALIVLVDAPTDDTTVDADDGHQWERLLPDRDAASVQRLVLELEGERREFARADGGWRILEPLDVPADADAVDALADAFTSAEVDAVPLDGDPAEYGLDAPRVVASLSFADGSDTTVAIGRDAPTGWHSYVRLGDDGVQRTTRTRLSAGLDEDLDAYRDHRVWSLSWDDVDRVRIDGPRAAVELTRHDDAWWVRAALAAPGDPPPTLSGEPRKAATALVEQALGSLRRLRIDRFADAVDASSTPLPWTVEVRSAGVEHELALAELDDGWLAHTPLHAGLVGLADGWQDDWLLPVPQWWAKDLDPAWQQGDAPPALDGAASDPKLPTDAPARPAAY